MSVESSSAELRRTPLYELHLESGGRMVAFAGYELPIQYRGVVEEHHAVRRAAGLFDVSHMGEIEVSGPGALVFLQRLVSNDVERLVDGRAQYNLLLDESGGILDDLLVYRLAASRYLLVVNAATRESDLAWIEERAADHSNVEVVDRSDELALLALQGPLSARLLARLTDVDLSGIRYYRHARGVVAGIELLISRTGYTGEDGFELYVDPSAAPSLWRELLGAGEDLGVIPAGLGARDTLRLEAGMLLSGQDFDRSTTPLEVGLGWAVKLDKGDFTGGAAVRRQLEAGLVRRLIAFTLTDRGIARHGHALELTDATGAPIARGTVSSGTWSPTLERALGLALVESDRPLADIEPGSPVSVDVRGRKLAGEVAALPFYRRPKKSAGG